MNAYEKAQAERRQGPQVIHELKTWPGFFGAVMSGAKTFEVRKMDRDFRIGDALCLREWDPQTQRFTGHAIWREVTFILKGGQFGVEPGFCVMGLGMVGR